MGVDFLITNLDKKQYIEPSAFGDCSASRYYMKGDHALALSLLLCGSSQIGLVNVNPPAGSWMGDRVYAVHDAAPPNELGILTTTEEDPDRNLYMMSWQEFEDFSGDAISMLCDFSPEFAKRMAKFARAAVDRRREDSIWSPIVLCTLGDAMAKRPSSTLRLALRDHVGLDWEDLYREASENRRHLDDDRDV